MAFQVLGFEPKNCFPPPPTFQTGCGLNGAGTDVTSHQDPVSRPPTARMARQTPLGWRERRKMVSLVADNLAGQA